MFHSLGSFFPSLSSMSATVGAAEAAGEFTKGELLVVFAILGIFLFVFVCLIALVLVARWKMFTKAHQPGWASIVPLYSTVKTLEITNYPLWWAVVMVVPIVNLFFIVIVTRRIAAVFGRGAWFTVGLIFLPFIFYPIVAWGKSNYSNSFPKPKPMSEAVKYTLLSGAAFILITLLMRGGDHPMHMPLHKLGGPDSMYATDGTYVYEGDSLIVDADPHTFHVFTNDGYSVYAADDEHVYFRDEVLHGADPKSFSVLSGSYYLYAKDSKSVYQGDQVVVGADPATFEVVASNESYPGYDAKDAHNTYCGIEISTPDDECSTIDTGPIRADEYYDN